MGRRIAIIGAESSIGRVLITLLSENGFGRDGVIAVTSSEYVGKKISFGNSGEVTCVDIEKCDYENIDIAVFVASDAISERYAEMISESGCLVIDSTYLFRTEEDVPLIVHEINKENIAMCVDRNIISVPGVAAAQISLVLNSLQKLSPIKRVVVSTYHSASHFGKVGMSELYDQTKSMYISKKVLPEEFPKQISFNCIPCIGELERDTTEERSIVQEIQRVMGTEVKITATCVFVPVFVSHSNSMNIEFCGSIDVEEAVQELNKSPSILVVSEESKMRYVTPIDCVNDDEVYVSRIREDRTVESGLNMWVVYDNIRRSSLNLVKIIKTIFEEGYL